MSTKLYSYFVGMRISTFCETASKFSSVHQQKGAVLNLSDWGTGIPDNDKRAHARDVSNLLIISLSKNYQFSIRDSKRMLLIL